MVCFLHSFTGQRILECDAPESSAEPQCSVQHRVQQGSELAGEQQASPYKELDNFVLTLVYKDGVQGCIRRWTYFVSEQLLVYDIGRFRWCHNVGRFHKSNNIIIVVDLKEEVWYQRCHDPECRRQNYRSSSYPLPQEVSMSYMLKEGFSLQDEEDQLFLMDELGNIELSQSSAPAPPPGTEGHREQAAWPSQTEDTEDWGEGPDDPFYLEALEDVERTIEEKGEISDELIMQAVTESETSFLS
ncbi:DNA-directed primase/polymerase protein-like [Brachyhypopomus gauderio]|uniref:DNA-directed primase/polymerase protein-like n=1 Tax=Brachyhypopomus gauderio TaxID=698409 RepID=UPI004041B1B0